MKKFKTIKLKIPRVSVLDQLLYTVSRTNNCFSSETQLRLLRLVLDAKQNNNNDRLEKLLNACNTLGIA